MMNHFKIILASLITLFSLSSCSSADISFEQGTYVCSGYEYYMYGVKMPDDFAQYDDYDNLTLMVTPIDEDSYNNNEDKQNVLLDNVDNYYYQLDLVYTSSSGDTYQRHFYELAFYEQTKSSITYIDKFLSTITLSKEENYVVYEIKYTIFSEEYYAYSSMENIKNMFDDEDYQLLFDTYSIFKFKSIYS